MPRDIRIQPNRSTTGSTQQPTIYFSGTTAASINLKVEDDGSIVFEGNNGGLFNITDSKDGLLSSVNDVSGLPIFAVYSSDKVIAGAYNQNALVVDTDKVFIGSDTRTVPSGTKLTVSGNTLLNGVLSASSVTILTTPTLSTTNNQFLTRNSTTGNVEYRDFSTISTGDTFVTGFTYSNNNLTITRNQGQPVLNVTINNFTGLTINGSFSATTYLGLPTSSDNYVTGGTFTNNTLTLNRQNGSVTITGFTSSDNYVTGGTYSNGSLTLNRQNGSVSITGFSTGYTLTSSGISTALGYTPLSADTFVTGFTYSNNNFVISQNQGQSPLSVTINTMTGLTINGNLSTTSISPVSYITFNTGSTVTGTTVGTVYFDNVEKALSYNTSINQGVTVNLGQQNYIRVFNNSGTNIERGKALEILSAFNGLPAVTLAINRQNGSNVVGVSSEIIPNNSEGIAITNGIISNIPLTGMSIGSLIYASDSIPGELDDASKYLNFPLTARTNQVGYVVQTGSTDGKLFVNINNENTVLSLTDLQRNVLEGNVISTGVFEFGGIFLSTGNTFNVGYTQGFIVDNTSNPLKPSVTYVKYLGQSGLTTPYLTTDTETYVSLTSGGTILLKSTFPTPQERRQDIYLGKIGHGNKTSLINAFNEPDLDISPLSQLRDMFTPIKLINDGVVTSPNGVNLNFNTSAGILWGLGINFIGNALNPSSLTIVGSSPTTFQYRTQTGGTATNTTLIDPLNYDLNGVITPIGSPAKQSTNQRIFLLQNGQIRLQYGQKKYTDLTAAIAGAQNETFVKFSNFRDNAILIGVLSVASDATNLSSPTQALFQFVSKFGELGGGTAGVSTTTLQQAYDNSSSPEIITNSTLNGVQFRDGTNSLSAKNIIVENFVGDPTAWITAGGLGVFNNISATTVTATSISNTHYIDFNTTQTGTTSTEGRLFWDTNNYTLSLGMKNGQATQQIGEEIYYVVEAANNLLDGRVVAAVGTTGSSGRILADYTIGDGSIPAIYTLGILTQSLSAGTIGYVTEFGLVRGLDTTGTPYGQVWSNGDLLYLSPTIPGGLTNVKPVSPNFEVLIALLMNVDSTNGIIFVRPKLGESLEALYDVDFTGTTEGDLLVYGSNSSWNNSKNLKGNYNLNGNLNITSGLTANTISVTSLGTSGNCVTDIFVDNLYGCSPITFHDSIQSIGSQATGTTSFAFGDSVSASSNYSQAGGQSTSTGIFGAYSGSVVNGLISLSGNVSTFFTPTQRIYLYDSPFNNVYDRAIFIISASTFDGTNTLIQLEDNTVNTSPAYILNIQSFGSWLGDGFIPAQYSHAEGQFSKTLDVGSHSEGFNTIAIGSASHTEGLGSLSIGSVSHAEGRATISIGESSHAEGFGSQSIANYSHAQGFFTKSIGNHSFSSGYNSISSGDTSFIHSTNSLVTGDRSVVLGGQNITGSTNDTVYVSNFNIFNTPITNNSLTELLVRDGNGDIGVRDFNSINYTPNLVTVGLTGGSSNFNSIKLAVDSITGASSTNPYVVRVGPGVYYEDPISMKSYVVVVGDSSTNTIIQAKDSNQTLLYGADQSMIQDCQIQGCTGTGVSAIVYSSSTVPQLNAIFYVENVRFGSNYTHVKNVGTLSGNSIVQCSNVKYGGYPFTLGFHATNDGSGVGRIQLRNVTSTNGGVTTQPNLVFAKVDKPSCALIVNGCLLTKAVGAAAGTGFWVEDGGSLRLTGVNFQRWVTGIYAPQSGSSPSIDAIALNFEGCTTDVNIVHSGATGKIQGTDNFLKTKININAPLYEVNTDPREIIVAKKGGDFSTIKSAVDYLAASGNTSSTSRYVISVGPGEFYEDEINLTNTPYVSIVGSNIQTTQILPNNVNQHLIRVGVNNEISFLSFANAPSGYAAIYCDDIGDYAQAHKCSFYDCDTNVWVKSSTQDTKFYGEYLDFNGTYTYGTRAEATNNYLALANIENYYNFPTGSNITYCNYATGSGATLNIFVGDQVSNGISGTTAFYIQNGAELNASTVTSDGCTYAVWNPNIGSSCRFDVDNASFVNGEWDLYIESPNTFGTFGGSSSHEKIYTVSQDIYWSFLDIDDGELDITRKASVTFGDGTHTDFTTLLFQGSTMGLMEGGAITVVSGLTVSTAAGFGYLAKTLTPNVVMRIDWVNSQITLGPNENKYIYINENSILSASGTKPSSVSNIILGRVITNLTDVSFIDLSPVHSDHTSNRYGSLFREAMGPIYATGSIVTESISPFNLNVTSGEYYYSSNDYQPIGGSGVTFTQYYRDGSNGWVTTATTIVNNTSYDGNGVLSALTSGYYTKHTLYLVGDGTYENYFLVLGQNEFSSLIQTENALLPTPPTFFSDAVTQVANIYIQQGFSGITQIEDIRPTIAFRAGGVNASSVHGNLLGLSADDHTQYLLVDGGRAMAGNLDMGGNSIVSAGTINNVTIQSHATRHQFNGFDPVGSVTPGPNYIPYADVNSKLDSWISTASTTTLGLVKITTNDSIAVGTNDLRLLKSITGGTFSNITNTLTLSTNDGSLVNISGLTSTDYFVTGGTFNGTTNTLTLNRQNGSVNITGFTSSGVDYYVTGGTYTSGTLTLNRQNGSVNITGFTTGVKANTVAGTSFTGNPKKFTVTFISPYPNTNYSITMGSGINRVFTWESKTITGFTINSNANTSFTENVDWVTTSYGEF